MHKTEEIHDPAPSEQPCKKFDTTNTKEVQNQRTET